MGTEFNDHISVSIIWLRNFFHEFFSNNVNNFRLLNYFRSKRSKSSVHQCYFTLFKLNSTPTQFFKSLLLGGRFATININVDDKWNYVTAVNFYHAGRVCQE